MNKKFFVFIMLVFLSVPLVASAQSYGTVPEFNPLCWKEDQCNKMRADFLHKTVDQLKQANNVGWVPEAPCNQPGWGKCLPAGVATTELSFGGKNTFTNIGELIALLYKYAIYIAAILGVIMIIVAGFQYITSGGNSEAISSAKKRIGGALMGVFLVYMSYFILNAINPQLTNLRLPQIWMVRPQNMVPEFCSNAPTGTVFAFGADTSNQVSPITKTPNFASGTIPYTDVVGTDKGYCGHRFFMQNGGTNTCFGNFCGKNSLCTNFHSDPNNNKYSCETGYLAGQISGGTFSSRTTVVVDNNVKLIAMCSDGTIVQVGDDVNATDPTDKALANYRFSGQQDQLKDECSGHGELDGFYLGAEVNDETGGATGWLIEGAKGSFGCDDWFAIGRTPGTSDCNVNLAIEANKVTRESQGTGCDSGDSIYTCSCSWASASSVKATATDADFKSHLISLAELQRGFVCNISVNRAEFPAQDNSSAFSGCIQGGLATGAAVAAATSLTVAGTIIAPITGAGGAIIGCGIGGIANICGVIDHTRCFNRAGDTTQTNPKPSRTQ